MGYSPILIMGYGILTLFILGYGIFMNFEIWDIGSYCEIRVKLLLIWDIADGLFWDMGNCLAL